jgi:putative oxidoreductase
MLNVAYTIGRILLPLVFVILGIQKLTNVGDIARLLAENNVPIPDEIGPYLGGLPKFEAVGYAIGAVELIAGLMILLGLKARWGALILVLFTACSIIFVHHFWTMQGEAYLSNMREALMNLSIMGGLLLVVACGSSPNAIDRR